MKTHELESFYSVQSKFYDATRWAFLFGRRRAIAELDLHPGETVIDFACGTGLNMRYILRTKGVRALGIDYSESMLQVARRNYPETEFIRGDISLYKFEEKADKIIISYGLSMVEEWERTIANIAKTLKVGGTLVVLDFHPWNKGLMKSLFYPLHRWWLLKHGVDPEKDISSHLKKYFEFIEIQTFHGGYNMIVRAQKTRE